MTPKLREPWLSAHTMLSNIGDPNVKNKEKESYLLLLKENLLKLQEEKVVLSPKEYRELGASLYEKAETVALRGMINDDFIDPEFIESQIKLMDLHNYIQVSPEDNKTRHLHVRGLLAMNHFTNSEKELIEECYGSTEDKHTNLLCIHIIQLKVERIVPSEKSPSLHRAAKYAALSVWYNKAKAIRPELNPGKPALFFLEGLRTRHTLSQII